MLLVSLLLAAAPVDGGVLPGQGTWWVAAKGPQASLQWGQGAEHHATWGSTCWKVQVEPRRVQVDEVSFALTADGGLVSPRLESRWRRSAWVSGWCTASWPTEALVFSSESDCLQQRPPRFERVCTGDAGCAWNAQPFTLGRCDDEVTQLKARLAVANEATDAEAFATLQRLEAVLSKGGTLSTLEDGACRVVTVRPRADEVSVLGFSSDAGTWSLTSRLEPIFGQAITSSEAFEGPNGGWGSGGPRTVELLLGKGRFVLGARTFWLARGCR
ncbi:MAG: hypothetical protein U0228_11755 [Myxococcaceae bacterium]